MLSLRRSAPRGSAARRRAELRFRCSWPRPLSQASSRMYGSAAAGRTAAAVLPAGPAGADHRSLRDGRAPSRALVHARGLVSAALARRGGQRAGRQPQACSRAGASRRSSRRRFRAAAVPRLFRGPRRPRGATPTPARRAAARGVRRSRRAPLARQERRLHRQPRVPGVHEPLRRPGPERRPGRSAACRRPRLLDVAASAADFARLPAGPGAASRASRRRRGQRLVLAGHRCRRRGRPAPRGATARPPPRRDPRRLPAGLGRDVLAGAPAHPRDGARRRADRAGAAPSLSERPRLRGACWRRSHRGPQPHSGRRPDPPLPGAVAGPAGAGRLPRAADRLAPGGALRQRAPAADLPGARRRRVARRPPAARPRPRQRPRPRRRWRRWSGPPATPRGSRPAWPAPASRTCW